VSDLPAPGSRTPEDEALLRSLAAAMSVADPVPAGWEQAAHACFDWLVLDACPADLAYDALDDTHLPVRPPGPAGAAGAGGTAGGTERRRLRFGAAGLAIEVEVQATSDAVRLLGRLVPAAPRSVRALLPGGSRETRSGESGAFQFEELPRGPVSLVVESDPALKTGWIVP
jgi:hypothetical protein